MIRKLQAYASLALIGLALVAAAFYAGQWRSENQGTAMRTDDGTVSKETVTSEAPLQALNKQQLQKQGKISKGTEQNKNSAVLATGTVSDDSGTLYVGAELDMDTGETRIIQNRPAAETMSRNAIGISIEANPDGISKEAYYSRTFVRAFEFYATGTLGGRIREDDTTVPFLRLNAEYRW